MKLSVRILDIDEHITDFHLSANPDGTEWKQSETEYAGPDFLLIFYVEPATLKIKDIKKGPNICSTDIELRQQFSELLFEETLQKKKVLTMLWNQKQKILKNLIHIILN